MPLLILVFFNILMIGIHVLFMVIDYRIIKHLNEQEERANDITN